MPLAKEMKSPIKVILSLPKAFGEAKQLFFTRHKVAPPVVAADDANESAFAVPKGIDVNTPEGQKALKHLQRARVRRAGFRSVSGVHVEPGSLISLLGGVPQVSQGSETSTKPKFLEGYTRKRIKGRDSVQRGVASARVLIDETARLDDMFRHTDHTVTMEERHDKARKKLEELDQKGGATVKWEESDSTQPTGSTTVKWE